MDKQQKLKLQNAANQFGQTVSAGGIVTMMVNLAVGKMGLALAGAVLSLVGAVALYIGTVTIEDGNPEGGD